MGACRGERGQGLADKVFRETVQDGVVLAKRVGFLEGLDLVQVSVDQRLQGSLFHILSLQPWSNDAGCERSKFGVFSPLDLQRLGDGRPGGQATALAVLAPLDEIAAIG